MSRSVRLVCIVSLIAGCSNEVSASRDAQPADDATVVTGNVGPMGGVVRAGSVTLTIPAGALSAPTDVQIRTSARDLSNEAFTPLGSFFEFSPSGLVFAQPATVEFALASRPRGAAIYWTRAGDETRFERLPSMDTGTALKALVTHFSVGGPAGTSSAAIDGGVVDRDAGTLPPDARGDPHPDAAPGDSGVIGPDSGMVTASGETCETAVALTPGVMRMQDGLTGFTADYGPSTANRCLLQQNQDRVYTLSVPSAQRVSFIIEPSRTEVFASLIVGAASACSATPPVCERARQFQNTLRFPIRWTNSTGSAQTVFLIVKGNASATNLYNIVAELDTPAVGDTCENPGPAIVGSTTLSAQTTMGFPGDTQTFHQDRVHRIDVPTDTRLTVSTQVAAGPSAEVRLVRAISNCYDDTPDRSPLGEYPMPGPTAVYVNGSGATESLYLIIGTLIAMPSTYDLTITFEPLVAGQTCTNAGPPITANGMHPITASLNAAYQAQGCYARYHAVQLPPLKHMRANLTHMGAGWTAQASVLTSCGPIGHFCGAGTSSLRVANNSPVALDVPIAVNSVRTPTGDYTLAVEIYDAPPGDSCDNAGAPIMMTSSLMATTTGYTNDSGTGPNRVHAITVPAGMQLTALVTPNNWFPTLQLLNGIAGCRAGTGQLAQSSGMGRNQQLMYRNTTMAPRDTFLIVDGQNSAQAGDYALDVTIAP